MLHTSCLESPSCRETSSQPGCLLGSRTSQVHSVLSQDLQGGPNKARALRNCIPLEVTQLAVAGIFLLN